MFLPDESCTLGENLAARSEQVDLAVDPDFNKRFVNRWPFFLTSKAVEIKEGPRDMVEW